MTPLEALNARLADIRPRDLLYLTSRPAIAPETAGIRVATRADVAVAADLEDEARCDCVLVADFLEHLPRAQGLSVLARLRDRHQGPLLVFIDHEASAAPWTADDFAGLGLHLVAHCGDPSRTLAFYADDTATYNDGRGGDPPCLQAVPAMWGKYFW